MTTQMVLGGDMRDGCTYAWKDTSINTRVVVINQTWTWFHINLLMETLGFNLDVADTYSTVVDLLTFFFGKKPETEDEHFLYQLSVDNEMIINTILGVGDKAAYGIEHDIVNGEITLWYVDPKDPRNREFLTINNYSYSGPTPLYVGDDNDDDIKSDNILGGVNGASYISSRD